MAPLTGWLCNEPNKFRVVASFPMSTSGHINLSSCHVVGDRAIRLPPFPYKTGVVASVLPAASSRGYVTCDQLAQATKVVLHNITSCFHNVPQHCCTLICLMTSGSLQFLGINVVNVLTRAMSFHSTDLSFAHFTNLIYDGQNKCVHALFHMVSAWYSCHTSWC